MPNLLETLNKSDWQTFRFDEIAHNISKRVEPGATDLTIYVGLEHLDSGSLHIKRTGTPADVDGTKLLVFAGDVIFGRRRAYQRKAAVATFDGICSAHALVLRAKPDVIEPRLFPFFLHSDAFMHRVVDISVGGLSPTVNWGHLKVEEFMLPPRDQQARLAELLWAADEVSQTIINTKSSLQLFKKLLGATYFTDKNTPQRKLKSLVVKLQDGSHFSPKVLHDEAGEDRFLYFTSKNIKTHGIDINNAQYVDKAFHASIYTRCDPRVGDILLTKDGANTGNVALNTYPYEMSLLSSVCLIRPDESLLRNQYLYQYMKSDFGNNAMLDEMTGTAIRRLTLTTLKELMIPTPAVEVQDTVVKRLNALDKVESELNDQLSASTKLRQTLINQIFSA